MKKSSSTKNGSTVAQKCTGCCYCSLFVKRLAISFLLGLVFGILCVYLASSSNPSIWGWTNPLMWTIIYNRILIGLAIAIGGVFTVCPISGIKIHPVFRGAKFGAFISLQLAIGALITPPSPTISASTIFWATIVAGIVYGIIIDLVATKFAGQGVDLLSGKKEG